MIKPHKIARCIGMCSVLLAAALSAIAQPSGQWDFNSGNLSATAGGALTYKDGLGGATETATVFGTTTALGIPDIDGVVAQVMKFPSNTVSMGLLMPTPSTTSGGGAANLVNDWTLIMDVLYPAESNARKRALINADKIIRADAELFVGANNGIGGTAFSGVVQTNTWYRLGFVVSGSTGVIRKYINGVEVGTETGVLVDDRYALDRAATAELFTDDNGEVASGYVNSIQLRGTALNAGQMLALAGPVATGIPQTIPAVPSFILSRSPAVNATGVSPLPTITVALKNGDPTITPGSVVLRLDGTAVAATVTGVSDGYDISYAVNNILAPQSAHTLSLEWADNVVGNKTNTWSFSVSQYQVATLPAPLFLETFDSLVEGTLPTGWVATNATAHQTVGFNLDDPKSDAYLDWVVISSNRLATVFGSDRRDRNPIVLNGQLIDSLVHGNFLYAESDNRQNAGGQVNVIVTPDYDLTLKSNIFVSFFSSYHQNQDNIGALEYSIDQGATWLPISYLLDDENQAADVIRTNGVIDVNATLTTARSDQAYATNYAQYIAAPISSIKPANISGRINDDSFESKRIEIYRIAAADGQSTVRFRLVQAGTSSWYWGIDDFGLYSINTPTLTTLASQKIDAGKAVTFSVTATVNPPFTYQWKFNGVEIVNATNASYTIDVVETNNAGSYSVRVFNSDGYTDANLASLTVVAVPEITTQPASLLTSPGWTAPFSVKARGRAPLTFQWLHDGAPVNGSISSNLNLTSVQSVDAGNYQAVVTSTDGSVTSSIVSLTVSGGPITSNLVAHLAFDGNTTDTSGSNNNATVVGGSTGFAPGRIGQAFSYTTKQDGSDFSYATFGYPANLKFDTNDFSVAFWINYTNQTDDLPFISNKNWDSSGNSGWGIFTQGNGTFRVQASGTPNSSRVNTTLTNVVRDGTWHHIAVSFHRGKNLYVILDGRVVSTTPLTVTGSVDTDTLTWTRGANTGSFALNIGQDGTGLYTDGNNAGTLNSLMDDLAIWRRAITPQEANAIYTSGLSGRDLTGANKVSTGPIAQAVATPGNLQFNWTPFSGSRLQTSTNLVDWVDVPGTVGTGAITIPIADPKAFFRLYQPN